MTPSPCRRARLLAVLACLGAPACASDPAAASRWVPPVLALEGTVAAQTELAFVPARPEDLPGVWESVSRSGLWARAGLKFLYVFNEDGGWNSCVLVADGNRHELLVLAGSFRFLDGLLDLGSGAPQMRVQASGDRLRLESDAGVLELRAVELPLW